MRVHFDYVTIVASTSLNAALVAVKCSSGTALQIPNHFSIVRIQ